MLNNRGITLIELVVTVAIMAIMIGGSSMFVLNQSKHRDSVEAQSKKTYLKTLARNVIRTDDLCNCQIDPNQTNDDSNDVNLYFDSTDTTGYQSIDLKKLKLGCGIDDPILAAENSEYDKNINITSVKIKDLKPVASTPNKWQGNLVLEVQPNLVLKDQSPISIKLNAFVDPASVAADPTHVRFMGCKNQTVVSGLIKTCPPNYVMVGNPDRMGTFCISEDDHTPVNYWTALSTCHNDRPSGFGPALLCNPAQWLAGCQSGSMLNATNDWEWAYDTDTDNTTTVGNGNCNATSWANFPDLRTFRCCIFM